METESIAGLSDWMGRLPMGIRNRALDYICIPGAHDSGAFGFNMDMGYAHDQYILKFIRHFKCMFVQDTVKRWAITQAFTINDQLYIGVRYFDIRLELAVDPRIGAHHLVEIEKNINEKNVNKACFIVHGLYAAEWLSVVNSIIAFLASHHTEVVIINVSHIYCMTTNDFRRFFLAPLQVIAAQCGVNLCTNDVDLKQISLEELCKRNTRLIVVGPVDENIEPCCYRSSTVVSKWPRKNNIEKLIKFMQAEVHTPVTPGLRVLQGVITPKFLDVLRNWRLSLAQKFSLPCRGAILDWMRGLDMEEISNINVLLMDQVSIESCRKIIDLNTAGNNSKYVKPPCDIIREVEDPEELEPIGIDGKRGPVIALPLLAPPPRWRSLLPPRTVSPEFNDPNIVIEEISPSAPVENLNRTSVMIQQIEMVLPEDLGECSSSLNSSEGTSGSTRSPIPPPKPKRHQQRRKFFVMEVEPIPDDVIHPLTVPDVLAPLSRTEGTPCRIAKPVTEDELRRAALGKYPAFGSAEWLKEREEFEKKAAVEDEERRRRKIEEKKKKAEAVALLTAAVEDVVSSEITVNLTPVQEEVIVETSKPLETLKPSVPTVEIAFEYTLAAEDEHAHIEHIEKIKEMCEEVAELAVREALTDGSITSSLRSDAEEGDTLSCSDEESPLIPQNVSNMVEDLVIHSTLDAMSNLEDHLALVGINE